MHDAIVALWFFLPAGVGNAAPILTAKLPVLRGWNSPIDAGRTLYGRRLLGDNKTWRGIASGIAAAIIVIAFQQYGIHHVQVLGVATSSAFYSVPKAIALGALFGLGALGGDALESFFKRQHGTPPGHSWIPFDQLDYIVGAALATCFVARLTPAQYAWALLLWPIIHLLATYIGYRIGLRRQPI